MSDVIPIISLCCVAGLYRIPARHCRRSLCTAGWCLVLGLLSLVPKRRSLHLAETRPAKGSLSEIVQRPSARRGPRRAALCTKLFFQGLFGRPPINREAPRGVWLLAAFTFVNGPVSILVITWSSRPLYLVGKELVKKGGTSQNIGGEAILSILLLIGAGSSGRSGEGAAFGP